MVLLNMKCKLWILCNRCVQSNCFVISLLMSLLVGLLNPCFKSFVCVKMTLV